MTNKYNIVKKELNAAEKDEAFNTLLKAFVFDYAEEKCDKATMPFYLGKDGIDQDMIKNIGGQLSGNQENLTVKAILDKICCGDEHIGIACSVSEAHWDPFNHQNGFIGCLIKADIETFCIPLGYIFE